MMLLREKNTFNISDVEFAIFEIDGKISVLKKSQKQPIIPSNLNIPTEYMGLTKDIIIDGKILEENLKTSNLNRDWLTKKIKECNFNNIEDVFYAGSTGNLYISSKKYVNFKHLRFARSLVFIFLGGGDFFPGDYGNFTTVLTRRVFLYYWGH